MTIIAHLKQKRQARLEKLIKLNAPQVILDNERRLIEAIGKIRGAEKFGILEFNEESASYGAHCGTYYIFDTTQGSIVYFPRWGGTLKQLERR